MSANPTEEEILRHHGPDRRYRLCRCSVCEEVQRCVPVNDFYDAGKPPVENDTAPRLLVCSGCFRKSLKAQGLTPSDQVEL